MPTPAFDTLKLARRLRESAGFIPEHAEAAAEAFAEAMSASDVATKADIAEVKRDIAELRADTKADIAELRADTKADIAELRTGTKADIAEVKIQIAETKADLLKVIIAALAVNVVTILGAMFGLAKLLGH